MRAVCFGDSNTYGYDPRSYFGGRYAEDSRWVDLLSEMTGWEIVNAGENGQEIPGREHALRQLGSMLCVDLLIVMLGTNDLLQGSAVENVVLRMESFLTQIPLEKKNILLIAPPPMKIGEWVIEKTLVSASVQLATRYQQLAQRLGVGFVNAGDWNISLTFDGVHFTEEGHRAFASGLYKALTQF